MLIIQGIWIRWVIDMGRSGLVLGARGHYPAADSSLPARRRGEPSTDSPYTGARLIGQDSRLWPAQSGSTPGPGRQPHAHTPAHKCRRFATMKHRPRIRMLKRSAMQRVAWELKHAFFIRLDDFGLRDRLRCHKCKKVGTWKPHEEPSRWLCKWCGWYEDVRRTGWCRPCNKMRVWMLKPLSPAKTPQERCGRVDPWRG